MGNYPGLCRWDNVITRVLKNGEGDRSQPEEGGTTEQRHRERHTASFGDGDGGHVSRNVCGLLKLESAGKHFLP